MANILAVTLKRVSAGLTLALLAPGLSACHDDSAGSTQRPAFVRTEIVRPRIRQTSVTLTGEVQARFSAELSFRVSGRVVERLVEVGAHVDAGEVLARLDPDRAAGRPRCRNRGRGRGGVSVARGNGEV